ncbi:MAG TPA: DNA methyltransferase, partial [Chthonomonadaceae bacterium]|nr:DNA methyltransferase [Chthonomonadaceae bacterium]
DLVLDCFCGSGTTAAVAEKLGRRWIACDLGRFAIHTARKRLLAIENGKPFVVQNLGRYERQAWAQAAFGAHAEPTQRYRDFLLQLYRARPLPGSAWLHGVKQGRYVHVGGVDAAVSMGDVMQILRECRRAIGSGEEVSPAPGVDVLGWDFALEREETTRQQAERAGIDLRLVRIPREVLEQRAVAQGDIHFYALPALRIETRVSGRSVTVCLSDFVPHPDDAPSDIRKAITHWEQWVDYWAIDWDNRSDTLHPQWQAYRPRKQRALQKQSAHTYPEPGTYCILVQVIDILGNDTTKALTVTVG